MKKTLSGLLLVAGFLGVAGLVWAQNSDGSGMPPPSGGGNHMTPPQQAIEACKGKAEGSACQAGPAGTGVCAYTPDKKYFACRPNHMPRGGMRGPGGPGGQGEDQNRNSTVTENF